MVVLLAEQFAIYSLLYKLLHKIIKYPLSDAAQLNQRDGSHQVPSILV